MTEVKYKKIVERRFNNNDFYGLLFLFFTFSIININVQYFTSPKIALSLLIIELIMIIWFSFNDEDVKKVYYVKIKEKR
jgi:hypothetical protein